MPAYARTPVRVRLYAVCMISNGSGTAADNESYFFFFQAEDGIRDVAVTGVQTCALPICGCQNRPAVAAGLCPADDRRRPDGADGRHDVEPIRGGDGRDRDPVQAGQGRRRRPAEEIGRGAWRGRGEILGGAGSFKKKKKWENIVSICINKEKDISKKYKMKNKLL